MRLLFVLPILVVGLSLSTLADDSSASDVEALRQEIVALKAEVLTLSARLADTKTMLTEMQATLKDVQQLTRESLQARGGDCAARLAELKVKRDKLLSLGYREVHPDVATTIAQIHALEKECSDGPDILK